MDSDKMSQYTIKVHNLENENQFDKSGISKTSRKGKIIHSLSKFGLKYMLRSKDGRALTRN